jgi:1-aminocyclopropane-1-carboxylate deaminase/D-cysteine desulfhydrase-like pyridoxal-dependent ACC family enzyme
LAEVVSTARCGLWVKRDDRSGLAYGGNKVRKLEHLLAAAAASGARRLLTVGAAGSHHVLATAVYGRGAGFDVAALLIPQPHSAHAVNNLRAGLACGLEAIAVPSPARVPRELARERRPDDFVIGPGGSNPVGTQGYIDAARELVSQVQANLLPMPNAVVVALGSGGTAAGLLAGWVALRVPVSLIAVRIVSPWWIGALRVVSLAHKSARLADLDVSRARLFRALRVERGYLGQGYGWSTEASERATALAAPHGIALDPTYTGKAFAAALDCVRGERYRTVLYWHTLSSAPLSLHLDSAPAELPSELAALFVR